MPHSYCLSGAQNYDGPGTIFFALACSNYGCLTLVSVIRIQIAEEILTHAVRICGVALITLRVLELAPSSVSSGGPGLALGERP